MLGWLHQHRVAMVQALRRLAHFPVTNLLGILLLAFALGLPAGLYRLMDRAATLGHGALHEPHLTLFMALDADDAAVREVWESLAKLGDVKKFRYVSNTEALADLKTVPGLSDAINALDHNPLPHTFIVQAKNTSPQALEALRSQMARWNKVQRVQLDSAWAQRLEALLQFGREGTLLLTIVLLTTLVLTVFNTVRQHVMSAQEEIEVASLLGATSGFIRRPFLYFGILQGFLGAIFAQILLWAGSLWFNHAVSPISTLYGLNLQLPMPSLQDTAQLLLAASLLGGMSAFLATFKVLKGVSDPS